MTDILNATTDFARLAELPEEIGLGDDETRRLRVRLLAEEFREYCDGEAVVIGEHGETGPDIEFVDDPDPVEIADGLADILVITWGTLLTYFGEECAREICRAVFVSNLAKVDGTHGPIVRRDDGKLLKPEGWQPPDVAGVLRRYGYLEPAEPDSIGMGTEEADTGLGTADPHGDINGGLT